MLTHGSISANASQLHRWFVGVQPGEHRLLAVLPLFHVFAMTVNMHLAIRIAAEIILRSEDHTSELQSLMRISYAVFCLQKKNKLNSYTQNYNTYIPPNNNK